MGGVDQGEKSISPQLKESKLSTILYGVHQHPDKPVVLQTCSQLTLSNPVLYIQFVKCTKIPHFSTHQIPSLCI